jgi:GntR family transcriptional regulator/MocR family aminotransferase
MASSIQQVLWKQLLERTARDHLTLQGRIRAMFVGAILDGHLHPNDPVPSSRDLATYIEVGRITVVLAYQQLVDEGYLVSRERKGHFVSAALVGGRPTGADQGVQAKPAAPSDEAVDWLVRLRQRPGTQRSIVKPSNWQTFPYPFLYGQFDESLFPTAAWRECSLKALSVLDIRQWAPDQITRDDESLVQQICSRVLPRRGVWATPDQLIVTVGAQHALYMVADLLMAPGTRVAIEDPCYPDARNIFASRTSALTPLPVDAQGLPLDARLHSVDYVYTTPSHQCPTGVTMPLARRQQLLALAQQHNFVVIEDDFESENSFVGQPTPALKSLDRDHRVIYIGSLSKTMAPGLRIGYIVGAPELIAELRALRRLMIRHPSTFIQRSLALFISLGYYDSQLKRLGDAQASRAQCVLAALQRHAPGCRVTPISGGGSFWVELPPGIEVRQLAEKALERGVLIEPGDVFFHSETAPASFFRLGFQSIGEKVIEPGIIELAKALHALEASAGRSLR